MQPIAMWFADLWQRLLAIAADSARLWRIAIWIPLLVVLPEFIQHWVEIDIGMFASRDAALALSGDSRRMLAGGFKVAGLVAAIIAAAAYWTRRDGARVRWGAFAVAFALNAVAAVLPLGLEPLLGKDAWSYLSPIYGIATLPLLVLLIGALFGDTAMNLGAAYRRGWLIVVRMVLLAAAGWLPLSWLHSRNHVWAMGQPEPLVWGLMLFDSLVVGLMACWAGTALHHGYGQGHPSRQTA